MVVQYDLLAPDIAATVDTVAIRDGFLPPANDESIPNFVFMQLAPDGKIYFMTRGSRYLSYIAKPNKKGKACMVVQHGIKLPNRSKFPPLYPNYRLGPLDGSPCDTLGLNNEPQADFWWFTDSTSLAVEFADNSVYEPTAWHWDFGDGITSQDTSPVHVFPAPGLYYVCLTVSNQYASDTICKDVLVQQPVSHARAPGAPDGRVSVFPNPAADFFQVLYELDGPGARFELFDATGRLVRTAALDGRTGNRIFDATMLAEGLYFWTIRERTSGAVRAGRLLIVR